jgi:oligoendopeptidase F
VDGAYCSHLKGEESRVLLNYKPSFDSVSTFAHEMGHAYHNLCLSSRTAIQRATPMTLAETASIFCETVVRKAVQRKGTDAERGEAVQGALQGSTQVVVDITSRFLFEKSVFERRQHRELSSRELCEIMLESQRETYGDGLDDALMHPYMWAVKSHYYGRSFYNFPYMFGLLFGLGLYAIYEQDPERFKGRYDDLLSSTGMADAATLAAQFDIDIRSEDFWEGSLDRIREDVDLFERLIN